MERQRETEIENFCEFWKWMKACGAFPNMLRGLKPEETFKGQPKKKKKPLRDKLMTSQSLIGEMT